MKSVCLFILFLCISALLKAQNTWSYGASYPNQNTEPQHSASVGINGKGYVIGFYPGNQLWEYNPLTYTWTQKASAPGPLHHASAFTINGIAYFGNSYFTLPFYSYNPATDTWAQIASVPSFTQISGALAFSIGTKGYVGGDGGELFEYDPVSDIWTQKATLSRMITHTVTGTVAGKGYVLAGFGASGSGSGTECWEYDPVSDSWTQKSSFPGGFRMYHAGFTIGNSIYVGTGTTVTGIPFDDFYEYRPLTDTWIQRADYLVACKHATGFAANNKGYFCLGQLNGGAPLQAAAAYVPFAVTGLEETELEPVLVIASNGIIEINCPGSTIGKVRLFSLQGQLLQEKDITESRAMLNFSTWPKGCYLLQITAEGRQFSRKLML